MTARRPSLPPAVDPASYPAVRAFLRGYLHEELEVEHGSAEGALSAFRAEADPAEREALRREGAALAEAARGLPLRELRRLLADGFGCAYRPRTREEGARLLALLGAA